MNYIRYEVVRLKENKFILVSNMYPAKLVGIYLNDKGEEKQDYICGTSNHGKNHYLDQICTHLNSILKLKAFANKLKT